MLGWTLMQSFHVFLGAKRLRGERNQLFRRMLLTVLALWLILVLPPVIDMLRLEIIRWQWMQTHNSFSSMDYNLPGIWYGIVWNPVSTGLVLYVLKYCAMFPVIGMTLWLTGFPNRKIVGQRSGIRWFYKHQHVNWCEVSAQSAIFIADRIYRVVKQTADALCIGGFCYFNLLANWIPILVLSKPDFLWSRQSFQTG